MKEVTLQIDNSKFKFFMELVQSLDFVKVKEVSDYNEPTKKEILEGIQQGMKEASLIQMGILKGQPIKELLDELQ